MKESYDFSKAVKNPYKFSEEEKFKATIEYLYKKSNKTKEQFKKDVDLVLP